MFTKSVFNLKSIRNYKINKSLFSYNVFKFSSHGHDHSDKQAEKHGHDSHGHGHDKHGHDDHDDHHHHVITGEVDLNRVYVPLLKEVKYKLSPNFTLIAS